MKMTVTWESPYLDRERVCSRPGSPAITVTRLTEEDDVVVAEGSVETQRKDGAVVHLAFCDVFEMQGGRIRRLISYLMKTR